MYLEELLEKTLKELTAVLLEGISEDFPEEAHRSFQTGHLKDFYKNLLNDSQKETQKTILVGILQTLLQDGVTAEAEYQKKLLQKSQKELPENCLTNP